MSCDTTIMYVYCYPVILSRAFQAFNVNFTGELQEMTGRPLVITFNTFNNCGYAQDKKQKKWIPPRVEDQLRDQNAFDYRKIKKTLQTGLEKSSSLKADDNDDSYDPSAEDIATNTSMDAFQTKMLDAFEQFCLTQDAHDVQLAELIEYSYWYTDELAHQMASVDRQEIMLA